MWVDIIYTRPTNAGYREHFPRKTWREVKMWNLGRKTKLLVIKKLKASIESLVKHTFQQPFYKKWKLIYSLNVSQLSSIQIPLMTHEWKKSIVLPVVLSCFQWSKLKWIGSFVSYNWQETNCFSYEKSIHSYHLNGATVLLSSYYSHCTYSALNNNFDHHVHNL